LPGNIGLARCRADHCGPDEPAKRGIGSRRHWQIADFFSRHRHIGAVAANSAAAGQKAMRCGVIYREES
jgi:hypothetical protein